MNFKVNKKKFSKLIIIINLFFLFYTDDILIVPLFINPIIPYEIILADDMSTDQTKLIF